MDLDKFAELFKARIKPIPGQMGLFDKPTAPKEAKKPAVTMPPSKIGMDEKGHRKAADWHEQAGKKAGSHSAKLGHATAAEGHRFAQDAKELDSGLMHERAAETFKEAAGHFKAAGAPLEVSHHYAQQADHHEGQAKDAKARQDAAFRARQDATREAATSKPPPGFAPIKGSKKGGYFKVQGGKRVYWYPDKGGKPAAKTKKAPKLVVPKDAARVALQAKPVGLAEKPPGKIGMSARAHGSAGDWHEMAAGKARKAGDTKASLAHGAAMEAHTMAGNAMDHHEPEDHDDAAKRFKDTARYFQDVDSEVSDKYHKMSDFHKEAARLGRAVNEAGQRAEGASSGDPDEMRTLNRKVESAAARYKEHLDSGSEWEPKKEQAKPEPAKEPARPYTGGGKMSSQDWREASGYKSGIIQMYDVGKVFKRQVADLDYEAAAELLSRVSPYSDTNPPEWAEASAQRDAGNLLIPEGDIKRAYPELAKQWNKMARTEDLKRMPASFNKKKLLDIAKDPIKMKKSFARIGRVTMGLDADDEIAKSMESGDIGIGVAPRPSREASVAVMQKSIQAGEGYTERVGDDREAHARQQLEGEIIRDDTVDPEGGLSSWHRDATRMHQPDVRLPVVTPKPNGDDDEFIVPVDDDEYQERIARMDPRDIGGMMELDYLFGTNGKR